MRVARHVAVASSLLAGALLAYVGYEVAHFPLIQLQTCIEHPTFMGASWICRQALYEFHPTKEEVEDMNYSAGIDAALQVENEDEVRQLLKHYQAAGVNINASNRRHPNLGWTALHLAASGGEARNVRLLLEAGASPTVTDDSGRTALDLVQQRTGSTADRIEVMRLLQGAMPERTPFQGGP